MSATHALRRQARIQPAVPIYLQKHEFTNSFSESEPHKLESRVELGILSFLGLEKAELRIFT